MKKMKERRRNRAVNALCICIYIYTMYLVTKFVPVMIVEAGCPGLCNGHGVCSTDNVCVCEELYSASPDCTQMVREIALYSFYFNSYYMIYISSLHSYV